MQTLLQALRTEIGTSKEGKGGRKDGRIKERRKESMIEIHRIL